eukprot:CAMPEP_0194700920 /NCGR_PEP_ID=MMETSP0295-20121207/25853_1 /TAXON_ID=39354 /ORGANISM="Heterosigma akashiwo, Strain CCMP2393" /LENGTH=79 /DNA_ID=CAMNT_0039594963 /DNA_START=244 /DNA_END=483 /DNA_ORIENTATION=+
MHLPQSLKNEVARLIQGRKARAAAPGRRRLAPLRRQQPQQVVHRGRPPERVGRRGFVLRRPPVPVVGPPLPRRQAGTAA